MHATYALNMRSAIVEALYKRYICVVVTGGGSAGLQLAFSMGIKSVF